MYGCDCYAYGLLAAGHADLVVEADLKPYDYMALVPVIQVRAQEGSQFGVLYAFVGIIQSLGPYDYMALVLVVQASIA